MVFIVVRTQQNKKKRENPWDWARWDKKKDKTDKQTKTKKKMMTSMITSSYEKRGMKIIESKKARLYGKKSAEKRGEGRKNQKNFYEKHKYNLFLNLKKKQ